MKTISRLFFTFLFGISLAMLALLAARGHSAAAPDAPQNAIRYVATTGSDTTDCTDSANPCATIQYAVDQAEAGDEVRVAGGEYTDVHARVEHDPFPPNETLTQTVFISQPLTVRGGYTLTNWMVSDPVANPTIINPQGQGRGIVVMTTQDVTLENFRVTGGDASVGGYLFSVGGGIGLFYAEAVVKGNVLMGNTGYGGLGVDSSTTLLHGNVITGHVNTGVYGNYSTLTMTQNTVKTNTGSFGAGIHIEHSTVTLVENQITENTASEQGGGVWLAYSPNTTVMSNTISDNTSGDNGGGMVIGVTTGQDVIVGNVFSGNTNTGGFGGGIGVFGNEVVFQGNTVWNNQAAYLGGGVYVSASYAELAHNEIQGNVSGGDGGGVWVEGAHLMILGNTVLSNTATTDGGGIYGNSSTLTITQNTISGNDAQHGGGIYLSQSDIYLAENTISHNSASQHGGGSYILNGPRAIVVGNSFLENTADNRGGGMLLGNDNLLKVDGNLFMGNSSEVEGGGLFLGANRAAFHNNIVLNNSAGWRGGGVYLNGGSFSVFKNEIRGNYSDWDGGGITALGAEITLTANSILSNTALALGGGVLVDVWGSASLINNLVADNQIVEPDDLYEGSGIYLQGGTATFVHNTVVNNHGGGGNGIYLTDGSFILTNNIIMSQTIGLEISWDATAQMEGTLWGNETDWLVTNATLVTGTINLWGNPGFVDPANGDYHLSPHSLAIDAGVDAGVTTDLDGDTRPLGAGFDIGADEFPAVLRYVATTGTDTTDCTDSANPCATIQYAVDQAEVGDEVRVAGGEYTGVNNHGGLSQMAYISKSITIRGGYAVTNWIDSDPTANPTILDAEGQGRVIYITGVISTTLEGLKITSGDASGLGGGQFSSVDYGGGLYVISATMTLLKNEFIGNSADAGGGVSIKGVTLISNMNVYSNNVALSFEGGGGGFIENSEVTFDSDSFLSNSSINWHGGGLFANDSTVTIHNSLFNGNSASALFREGGALFFIYSTTNLQNNTFVNNLADSGGAIYLGMSTATLENNFIAINAASWAGGGFLFEHSDSTLLGNTIISNTSAQGGAGYFQGGGTLPQVVSNGNLIAHNIATEWGGGFRIDNDVVLTSTNDQIVDNEAGSYGSGIFMGTNSTDVRFIHSTIANNTGGEGIGILSISGRVWLTNTILVSHTIGIRVDGPGSGHVEATLWDNLTNITGSGTITTGTINLYGNPDFVDPANGDYHLNSTSIAIDAGIDAGVTTDLDGDTRPQGLGFDIGADEFVAVFAPAGHVQLQGRSDHSGAVVTAWSGGTIVATDTTDSSGAYLLTVPDGSYTLTIEMPLYLDARKTNVTLSNSSPFPLTSITLKGGDTNDSDKINILDLAFIGAHYGLTCADPDWDPRADINSDCVINLLDLVLAAGNFGRSSPLPWD